MCNIESLAEIDFLASSDTLDIRVLVRMSPFSKKNGGPRPPFFIQIHLFYSSALSALRLFVTMYDRDESQSSMPYGKISLALAES